MLTVRETVERGGLMRGDRQAIVRRRAAREESVPLVRERAGQRAGSLSGGQQKLLEIARALMLDPRVLLLDEPSAGLDPRSAAQVYGTIRDLHAAGRTILLVEQNVRVGLKLASHAAVLDNGQVKLEGSGQALLDDPRVAALYLGGSLAASNARSQLQAG
jgi:branched-chain amino acid transport system ATP-binding protein